MSAGLTEQIEHHMHCWGGKNRSQRWVKTQKHRTERRRAKANPECPPYYRKYSGWEY